jgi:predicted outer membrane repeat protein
MQNLYKMRTFQTLLFCFFSTFIFAQTFVKLDAVGTNDGSSWDNAFTDLQAAFDNSASGEIWVAAGTYTPTLVDTNSTFRIANAVDIYGGFVGTEVALADRDVLTNVTIFSGDTNGDDIPGNTTSNRTDNTRHIITVDSLIAGVTVFDGITFSGGHTGDNGDLELWHRAGGGIYSYSPILVNQCTFIDNFGRSGSGVYVLRDGHGSSCSNSSFSSNRATAQAGGFMANGIENLMIENCQFVSNTTVRGALYTLNCINATITSTNFINNINTTGFGGAYFNWNSIGVLLEDCDFTQNMANSAGAVYHDGRNLDNETPTNFVMKNCSFIGNSSTNNTGALQNWQGSVTFEDCIFSGNTTGGSGGHLSLSAANETVIMTGCTFGNSVSGGWGGAHTAYGDNANFQITDCMYVANSAAQLGGAVNCGFNAKVLFDDCLFQENTSTSSAGGAISMQNDSTSLTVLNSEFVSNVSFSSSGGAIHGNDSHEVVVDNCYFEANSANFGGAINLRESNDEPEDDFASLMVSNSIFNFNLANEQGGAISVVNNDLTVYNAVIVNNIASDPGTGGGISFNVADENTATANILNSTFADNLANIGGAIGNWTGTINVQSDMTIQNNIFRGDGVPNYVIEDGTPNLISNGGNFSDDNTISDIAVSTDIFEDDPLFEDANNFDYHIRGGSPCIDAGVDAGAPEFDLEGTPRVGAVDIGAYEFDPNSVRETILDNEGMLNVFPNPTHDFTKAEINNHWKGDIAIRLYNVLGQVALTLQIEKGAETVLQEIDLTSLRNGVYHLVASNGTEAIVQKITKF